MSLHDPHMLLQISSIYLVRILYEIIVRVLSRIEKSVFVAFHFATTMQLTN